MRGSWLLPLAAATMLVPPASADATLTVEPDHLRLSAYRAYPLAVQVAAHYDCNVHAPPPAPVRLRASPAVYAEELGAVFVVEPSDVAINWTASTQSSGRPSYTIQQRVDAHVDRVGQPFEDRERSIQWWIDDIRLGSDCVVTADERSQGRSSVWDQVRVEVPVVAQTHEPRNSPLGTAASGLVALAAAALALRARP